MFNRIILKGRAKAVLSQQYWQIFLVIFLANAIVQTASFFVSIPLMPASFAMEATVVAPEHLIAFVISFLLVLILGFILTVFVEAPILVGIKRVLLDASLENKADIKNLFFGFQNGYKSIATASLMKNLIILGVGIVPVIIAYALTLVLVYLYPSELWVVPVSLVIVYASLIPLLIKNYDYYMTDYILAENPDTPWREVLGNSKTMMRGNRWRTFVMHLSFIGWLLLGVCACFVGTIFVLPYIEATDAQLYLELSGKGRTDFAEQEATEEADVTEENDIE